MMLAPIIIESGGDHACASFVLSAVSVTVAVDATVLLWAVCSASVVPLCVLMVVALVVLVCFSFNFTGIFEGGVDAVSEIVCLTVSTNHVNVLPSGSVSEPSSMAPVPAMVEPGTVSVVSISRSCVVTLVVTVVSLLASFTVAVTVLVVVAFTSVFVAVWLRSLCLRVIAQDVVQHRASSAISKRFIVLCA